MYINIEVEGGDTSSVVELPSLILNPLEKQQGRTDKFHFLIAASSIVQAKPFNPKWNLASLLMIDFPSKTKWLYFNNKLNLCMLQVDFYFKTQITNLKL